MRIADQFVQVGTPGQVLREHNDMVRAPGHIVDIAFFVDLPGIVVQIPFGTENDLDLVAARIICLGQCMHDAVVGDGDGFVPPLDGAFDERLRVRQTVEGAHLGMGVQLDALLFAGIFALRHLPCTDVARTDDHAL